MNLFSNKMIFCGNRGKLLGIFWAAAGATIAITLALLLATGQHSLFLFASLGGSTVFLFALTETEAAQPRALFGGHIGGAMIGILFYQIFGDALWVSVAAVVLTMVLMISTRTIHPPAGANPLIMVHGHAGFSSLLNPVGAGVLALFLVAMLWSRLRPGKPYPSKWR
jgi:CBS-domain-containing membrane protein